RRRGRLVSSMLARRLRGAAEVTVGSPLSLIRRLDVPAVDAAGIPRLVHEAACRADPLWEDLLAGQDPDLEAIVHARYVHHCLSAARAARQRGRQLVLVENPEEKKIHRVARGEADRTGISMAGTVGCYIHPRVAVTQLAPGCADHILRECRDGCDPRTIAIAMSCYASD